MNISKAAPTPYVIAVARASAMAQFFSSVRGSDESEFGDLSQIVFNPILPHDVFLAAYDALDKYLGEQEDESVFTIDVPVGYVAWQSFENYSLIDLMENVDDHVALFLEAMVLCTSPEQSLFSSDVMSSFEAIGWRIVKAGEVVDVELTSDSKLSSVADAWKLIIAGAMGADETLKQVLKLLKSNPQQYERFVQDVDVIEDTDFDNFQLHHDSDAYSFAWHVVLPDNTRILFSNEDAACQYQRQYRASVGLDTITGQV